MVITRYIHKQKDYWIPLRRLFKSITTQIVEVTIQNLIQFACDVIFVRKTTKKKSKFIFWNQNEKYEFLYVNQIFALFLSIYFQGKVWFTHIIYMMDLFSQIFVVLCKKQPSKPVIIELLCSTIYGCHIDKPCSVHSMR